MSDLASIFEAIIKIVAMPKMELMAVQVFNQVDAEGWKIGKKLIGSVLKILGEFDPELKPLSEIFQAADEIIDGVSQTSSQENKSDSDLVDKITKAIDKISPETKEKISEVIINRLK